MNAPKDTARQICRTVADDVGRPPASAGLTAVVTIPGLRLKTPGNRLEHWRAVATRAKEERGLARVYLAQLGADVLAAVRESPRLKVRFVRVGGRKMDSDNLVASLKHIRDGLADWCGVDDKSDWYEWVWPAQEPGAGYAVRIELTTSEG